MNQRKSGKCLCDEPTLGTVMAVRSFAESLGRCWWCGDYGLHLMRFGWERLHVRCLYKKVDRKTFAVEEMHQRRVRLCCLGPRIFKWLLHATFDDGANSCAARDW